MSTIYCGHVWQLKPRIDFIKLGCSGSDNPAINLYSYARKHKLPYDKRSLLILHCDDYRYREEFAHEILNKVLSCHSTGHELFLLGGHNYWVAAYLIMFHCQRDIWQMTGEEPEPVVRRDKPCREYKEWDRPFNDCAEFPRHIPRVLELDFAAAAAVVQLQMLQ